MGKVRRFRSSRWRKYWRRSFRPRHAAVVLNAHDLEDKVMKRFQRISKPLAVGLISTGLSLTVLHAHVVVTPRESQEGAEQTYTVRVPTEGTVSTTSLELDIPPGLHVMQVASGEGFTFAVRKENDRIVAITWTREDQAKGICIVYVHGT